MNKMVKVWEKAVSRLIPVFVSLIIMVLSFASLYIETTDFEYQSYVRINPVTQEEEVIDTREISSYEDLMNNMAVDFFNVKSENEDVVGFLNIPNIGYYPIVMGQDNQFYLNHNEYKEPSKAGIPFMNTACEGTFDDIALIHGHKMKSGAMFGALSKYKDEEFFRNNDLITVFDGEYLYVYKPFSVFTYIDGRGDVVGDKMKKNERKEYLNGIYERSMFQVDTEEIDLTNQVLFLSTCDYMVNDGTGRMAVAGVMVEKVKYVK